MVTIPCHDEHGRCNPQRCSSRTQLTFLFLNFVHLKTDNISMYTALQWQSSWIRPTFLRLDELCVCVCVVLCCVVLCCVVLCCVCVCVCVCVFAETWKKDTPVAEGRIGWTGTQEPNQLTSTTSLSDCLPAQMSDNFLLLHILENSSYLTDLVSTKLVRTFSKSDWIPVAGAYFLFLTMGRRPSTVFIWKLSLWILMWL